MFLIVENSTSILFQLAYNFYVFIYNIIIKFIAKHIIDARLYFK